jgi:hypothetical protein
MSNARLRFKGNENAEQASNPSHPEHREVQASIWIKNEAGEKSVAKTTESK